MDTSNLCNVCGRLFTNSQSLNNHKRYHEDDPVKCETCDKIFKNKDILTAHERLVHVHPQIRRTCNMCEKSFTDPSCSSRHKLLNKEKQFQCQLCKFFFARNDYLQKHENFCYKKLGKRQEVKEPEIQKPEPSKFDHKCKLYEKTFKSKRNLEQHLISHEKKRLKAATKFSCILCPKQMD